MKKSILRCISIIASLTLSFSAISMMAVGAVVTKPTFDTTDWERVSDGWKFENGNLSSDNGYAPGADGWQRVKYAKPLGGDYTMTFNLVRPAGATEKNQMLFYFSNQDGTKYKSVNLQWNKNEIVVYDSNGRAYWMAGSYNSNWYANNQNTEFAFRIVAKNNSLAFSATEGIEQRTINLEQVNYLTGANPNGITILSKSPMTVSLKALTVTPEKPAEPLPELTFDTTDWARNTTGWSFENGNLKLHKEYPSGDGGWHSVEYAKELPENYSVTFDLVRPTSAVEKNQMLFYFTNEDGTKHKYVNLEWNKDDIFVYDSSGVMQWMAGGYNAEWYKDNSKTAFAFTVTVKNGRISFASTEGIEARSVTLANLTFIDGAQKDGITILGKETMDLTLSGLKVTAESKPLPPLPFEGEQWLQTTEGFSYENGVLNLHPEYPSENGNFYLDLAGNPGKNYNFNFRIVKPERSDLVNEVQFFFKNGEADQYKALYFQWNKDIAVVYDSDGKAYFMAGSYNAEWYTQSTKASFAITVSVANGQFTIKGDEGFEARYIKLDSLAWKDGNAPSYIRIAGKEGMGLTLKNIVIEKDIPDVPVPDSSDLNGLWKQIMPGWTYNNGTIALTNPGFADSEGNYYLDYLGTREKDFTILLDFVKPKAVKRNEIVLYFSNADNTKHKSVSFQWGSTEVVAIDSDNNFHWMAGSYNLEWYGNYNSLDYSVKIDFVDGKLTLNGGENFEKRIIDVNALSWKDGAAPTTVRLIANSENDFKIKKITIAKYMPPEYFYLAKDWKTESKGWSYNDGTFSMTDLGGVNQSGNYILDYTIPLSANYNLDFDVVRPQKSGEQQMVRINIPVNNGKDYRSVLLLWTNKDFAVYPQGSKDGQWLAGSWNMLGYAASEKESFTVKVRMKDDKVVISLQDNQSATVEVKDCGLVGEAFTTNISMVTKDTQFAVKNIIINDKDKQKEYRYVSANYSEAKPETEETTEQLKPNISKNPEQKVQVIATKYSDKLLLTGAIALPAFALVVLSASLFFLLKKKPI